LDSGSVCDAQPTTFLADELDDRALRFVARAIIIAEGTRAVVAAEQAAAELSDRQRPAA
jgi:hypothetical protein